MTVRAARRGCVALAVGLPLLAPAPAPAAKATDTYFNSIIPLRIDHLIGFTPTSFAIHPRGKPVVPITVRWGGKTHRYIFGNAAAAVGPSATIVLRNMIRQRRYPGLQGVFLDRRLTVTERRYLKVRADLGRDADVLVAAREHPACTAGISRATVRGIAAGRVRSWSAAGVPAPEAGDAIGLRRAGTGVEGSVEPRFGAGHRLPSGARAAYDGGIGEAASGNTSIAAVTSWSRARSRQGSVCVVPIAGAAVDDASVRALTHRDAYPITYVVLKHLGKPSKGLGPITAAFIAYLRGSQAQASFARLGMLPAAGSWPAVGGGPPA